jgi:hypothetical protein
MAAHRHGRAALGNGADPPLLSSPGPDASDSDISIHVCLLHPTPGTLLLEAVFAEADIPDPNTALVRSLSHDTDAVIAPVKPLFPVFKPVLRQQSLAVPASGKYRDPAAGGLAAPPAATGASDEDKSTWLAPELPPAAHATSSTCVIILPFPGGAAGGIWRPAQHTAAAATPSATLHFDLTCGNSGDGQDGARWPGLTADIHITNPASRRVFVVAGEGVAPAAAVYGRFLRGYLAAAQVSRPPYHGLWWHEQLLSFLVSDRTVAFLRPHLTLHSLLEQLCACAVEGAFGAWTCDRFLFLWGLVGQVLLIFSSATSRVASDFPPQLWPLLSASAAGFPAEHFKRWLRQIEVADSAEAWSAGYIHTQRYLKTAFAALYTLDRAAVAPTFVA